MPASQFWLIYFVGFAIVAPVFLIVVLSIRRRLRCRLPISANVTTIDDKLYALLPRDERALLRLKLIADYRHEARQADTPVTPLVAYRQVFREIIREQPFAGLVVALRRGDPVMRRLAVWLLGRCRGYPAIGPIAELSSTTDRSLRKAVAKTLARLRAWSELRRLHELESDPAIRRLSAAPIAAPIAERLQRYARQVENVGQVSDAQMPLVMACEPTAASPPKSRHVIRRLLEQIAALVRGSRYRNGV